MPDYHIIISLFKPAKSSPNTFIPASLFDTLPNHPQLISSVATTSKQDLEPTPLEASRISTHTSIDYRLGPVGVNWVDFVSENEEAPSETVEMKRAGNALSQPLIGLSNLRYRIGVSCCKRQICAYQSNSLGNYKPEPGDCAHPSRVAWRAVEGE